MIYYLRQRGYFDCVIVQNIDQQYFSFPLAIMTVRLQLIKNKSTCNSVGNADEMDRILKRCGAL